MISCKDNRAAELLITALGDTMIGFAKMRQNVEPAWKRIIKRDYDDFDRLGIHIRRSSDCQVIFWLI